MAERILLDGIDDLEFQDAVSKALKYLTLGGVIIAAAEHGYIYLAKAFKKEAIKTIHILRGNSAGVVLQVLISDEKVASGIATALTVQQQEVLKTFWPGLLSVTVNSQPALTWNLGDERKLGKVNLRVPKRRFLNAILEQSGPLAISSASPIGLGITLDLGKLVINDNDVAAVFDEGVLTEGLLSTWLEFSEKEITLKRLGAITMEQLQVVIPTISA